MFDFNKGFSFYANEKNQQNSLIIEVPNIFRDLVGHFEERGIIIINVY